MVFPGTLMSSQAEFEQDSFSMMQPSIRSITPRLKFRHGKMETHVTLKRKKKES